MNINWEMLLSILTIALSLIAWLTSYRHNRFYLESTAFNLIHNAKSVLDKETLKANSEINYAPLIEDYVNALNYSCSLYIENKINKKRFKVLYKEDIIIIFTEKVFQDVLNKNIQDFTYLREVYLEIVKTSKE